jgi:flagellar hook-length control protein FliK
MATIASNISVGAGGGAGAGGTKASADDARASGSSDEFMRLVNGTIQGNTPEDLLASDLLQLLLTGDTAGLDGLVDSASGDSGDGSDDDGSDEAAAAGLAALLAGLQANQSAQAANASGGDGTGVSIEALDSQKMQQALLATSQAGLAAAFGDIANGANAGDKGAATGLDPNTGLNPANNANGAAHLQNTLLAHRAADLAPQAASVEVRTPVGAQGWSDEIGTHLAIMAANGREAASLRLSPEHLGPLEVQISMKDGQANVVFGASNPDTRQALEQSLPRLREMFAAQGLTLGNANVSRDGPRDSFKPAPFARGSRGSSDASEDISVKRITLSRLGLVDTYV